MVHSSGREQEETMGSKSRELEKYGHASDSVWLHLQIEVMAELFGVGVMCSLEAPSPTNGELSLSFSLCCCSRANVESELLIEASLYAFE